MQCVANGAPYVASAVIGLRVMAFNATRRATRAAATDAPPDGTTGPASRPAS